VATSFGIDANVLARYIVREGRLVPVEVEGIGFDALPEVLTRLDEELLEPKAHFLAPLDQLMGDRKAKAHLFDFDYIWEVYKPEIQRKWGCNVLPVMVGDRFVARVDSRLEGTTWHVKGSWWEDGANVKGAILKVLEHATAEFLSYLGAHKVKAARRVDRQAREVLTAAAKAA
jgi:uncharacterized protein YcaQ